MISPAPRDIVVPSTALHAVPAITPEMRRALGRVGLTAAKERRIIPQSLVRGELTIGGEAAMLDANREWIRQHANLRSVKVVPLSSADVTRALRALVEQYPEPHLCSSETEIAKMLTQIAISGGSDLFVIPTAQGVRVVGKIVGATRTLQPIPLRLFEEFVSGAVATRLGNQVDFKVSQTGRYEIEYDGVRSSCRLRTRAMNLVIDSDEKALVMLNFRLHPDQRDLPQPEELGIRSEALSALRRVLEYERLSVLVSGMPDSGKTTTLLSLLREIARLGAIVFTFEAPKEMQVDELIQTDVSNLTNDQGSADRQSLLQMNPDLVFVGEALARESFAPLMEFIEANIPSVTTLHEHTALWALYRAMQLGGERFLNKAGLIWCQHLIAPVCKFCAKEVPPSTAVQFRFKAHEKEVPSRVWRRTVGAECSHCLGMGVTGPRRPLVEFFYVNAALRRRIRGGAWEPAELAKDFYPAGVTMAAQGIEALCAGEIDEVEFLRVGDDLV